MKFPHSNVISGAGAAEWNGGVVEQAAHKLVLVAPVEALLRLTCHLGIRAKERRSPAAVEEQFYFQKPAVPNMDAAVIKYPKHHRVGCGLGEDAQ